MDLITALHTAARRYCFDRYEYWHDITKESLNKTYAVDKNGQAIHPRIQAIHAILAEIERFTPSDFKDFKEARNLISLAGQTAENIFTTSLGKNPNFEKIIQNERDAFSAFIQKLTENGLSNIQPLPYRRVLMANESQKIWKALNKRWKIDPKSRYWYPLVEYENREVEAFDAAKFIESSAWETLPSLLLTKKVNRIYELPELGEEREISIIDENNPFYHGLEIFWTTKDFETVIYISHENTLTLAGWLLDDFKQAFSEWPEFIYRKPEL